MLKDITLGQYYPTESIIHRLDPRVKLLATLMYLVSLFLFHDFVGFVVVTLFLLVIIKLSRVPFSFMLKGVRAIWVLVVITAVCNLFFTQGDNTYFAWKFIHITDQGVSNTVYFTIRLIYLVVGTSVMTLTTTPNQLTDGIEQMLRPLRKLHIPVHEFALMMSIALRFIPILMEELDKIMKAQLARGADFESGNFLHRLKNMLPILLPLFASAMRRANELAYAMDARCYHGGEGRTKMKPLRYGYRDMIGYISIVCYLIVLIAVDRIVAF